jgi:hypothetical protein
MASDEECMCYVREYLRLAGLTDDRNVRDQLLDLARGWMAVALSERSHARVLTFPPKPGSRYVRPLSATAAT